MTVKYAFETSGEHLLYHVQVSLLNNVDWARLSTGLLATGRAEELTLLFREIAAVNTTCRLVQAARSMRIGVDNTIRLTNDPSYLRDLRIFLREAMLIPIDVVDQTLRLSVAAAQAANSSINETTRKRMLQEAKNRDTKCYLCGCDLDFDLQHHTRKFELEHIWPNSYGGDSNDSNLLPACHGCNQHKGDLATWGMAGIQSLILGINPSENALKLRGDFTFAIHYFAARRLLAKNPQRSLKWAMQRLGPRQSTARTIDPSLVVDFFNLENHNPKIPI